MVRNIADRWWTGEDVQSKNGFKNLLKYYVKISVPHVFSLFQVIIFVLTGLYISQHARVYHNILDWHKCNLA